MKPTRLSPPRVLVAGLLVAAASAVPSLARAQAEVRIGRAERSAYGVELEPHLSFGAENVYGNTGLGAGVRLGAPLVTGHLGRQPDNLALSFGADILHYDNCYYGGHCGANYLMVPVAAQGNLFLGRTVSIFAEAGAFLYKGWLSDCAPGEAGCSAPPDFGILPTVGIGARLHVGDTLALTGRLGYPTSTLGLSFM